MVRALVNREDVADAIAALRAQGVPDPGVHRLRAALGRGSVTTIARLKAELRREDQAAREGAGPPPLPDPLSAAAGRLWEDLLAAVEAVEDGVHREAEARVTAAEAALADRTAERDRLQARLEAALARADALAGRIGGLETEAARRYERLLAQTQALRVEKARARSLVKDLAETSTRVAVREKALQDEAAQVREAVEAAARAHRAELEGVREEATRERIAGAETRARLETELAATAARLEEASAAARDLANERDGLRGDKAELERALGEARREAEDTGRNFAEARRALELLARERDELRGALEVERVAHQASVERAREQRHAAELVQARLSEENRILREAAESRRGRGTRKG